MKKTIFAIFLFTITISAQDSLKITNAIRKSFASEKITVANTAIGFTAATINPIVPDQPASSSRASAAVCSLETGDIRILTSGTPTSSTGLYITAAQSFTIYGYDDISAFLGIRVTSTSGVINCIYYR